MSLLRMGAMCRRTARSTCFWAKQLFYERMHISVIHGADIGEDCLVGMNSVVMDQVEVGAGSISGALTFVHEGMKIPSRSVVVGNPARIVKSVSEEMLVWKKKGTALYQTLPSDMKSHCQEVEALHEMPANRPSQEILFENWDNIKNKT